MGVAAVPSMSFFSPKEILGVEAFTTGDRQHVLAWSTGDNIGFTSPVLDLHFIRL